MKTATYQLNGHPFFVRSWGDPTSPVLLMLHGFPEYGGAWSELAEELCSHFYCIAPDQRGYGQSWTPDGVEHYAASAIVADALALLEQIGSPAVVLGHDWGAAIAYGLAMSHPDHVSKLIIANGVHPIPFQRALAAGGAQAAASQYFHDLRTDGFETELAADGYEKLQSLFSKNMDMSWLQGDRLAAYQAEWARPGRLTSMVDWYRASPIRVPHPGQSVQMPQIPPERFLVRQPHLLVWGENDTALLPEATAGLEDYAPRLERVTLPGCDHWLHHQKPAELAAVIRDWCART